jgi:UDP-3-O-[3-hydroxymyristoyl] glucosamine N-acyltransferase
MEFTVNDIAALLNGTVEGDGTTKVSNISKIDQGEPGTLTFLSNPAYTRYIYTTQASAVIVRKDFQAEAPLSCALIKVEDPYASLARLLNLYEQSKPVKRGIEQPSFISTSASTGNNIYVGAFAYIADKATIGNNCRIYPQAYIGENVVIGENTIIYAGAKIYADCKIGSNCIIHAGAVIGSDGFGFAPTADGSYSKIAQVGNVIIEDHVEIGANTTVDCATMGSTIIRKGVKLDNLIQIAHNVEVGENSVMASQTGIAGSTKVGKNCMFGGQVGLAGHITIGDNVKLGAQSGVMSSIDNNSIMIGSPVMDQRQYMKSYAVFRNLPQLRADINQLQRESKSRTNE